MTLSCYHSTLAASSPLPHPSACPSLHSLTPMHLFFPLPLLSDPPAAPTSTPEPNEGTPESPPLPLDLPDHSRHNQWHPQQQRQHQPQWKTDTVISKINSGRSPTVTPGSNRADAAPPSSLSSPTAESGVLQHTIREQVSGQASPPPGPAFVAQI